MRCVVLDTETTGLETRDGHRIIEIGAVELINRRRTGRRFHHYLQPDREVDAGAFAVHGIDTAFLADKPRFADIATGFVEFIQGAELVIHNAAFDVAFIDHELALLDAGSPSVGALCRVVDTLGMARQLHPGQRNSLDALCRRYGVDNSQRELHGALLDAEILADVYLAMTGGQVSLSLGGGDGVGDASGPGQGMAHRRELPATRPRLRVIAPDDDECEAHRRWVARLDDALGKPCAWHRLDGGGDGGGEVRQ